MSHEKTTRVLIFGEVLFDRFPDGSVVLGGAPFNVAWHLQAFGLSPLFVSRVGDDPLGRQVKSAMLEWGMDTSGLQLDSAHATGTVDVHIAHDEPSFDIVENRAYDFIDASSLPPIPKCELIYHGSLALRNQTSRDALEALKRQTDAPVFVDINLRSPWWNRDSALSLLTAARWAKLNVNELTELTPYGADTQEKIDRLLSDLDVEFLCVTLGAEGASIINAQRERYHIAPQATTKIVDTVGAGDAFSSILLLGVTSGWPIESMLERAQEFASAIVGVRGATTTNQGFYRTFLEAWA